MQGEVVAQLRDMADAGPTEAEIKTLVQCERQLRQEEEKTNVFWCERLAKLTIRSDWSGDLENDFEKSNAARIAVLERAAEPGNIRDAVRETFPPVHGGDPLHTVVDLRPRRVPSCVYRVVAATSTAAALFGIARAKGIGTAVAAGAAAAATAACHAALNAADIDLLRPLIHGHGDRDPKASMRASLAFKCDAPHCSCHCKKRKGH